MRRLTQCVCHPAVTPVSVELRSLVFAMLSKDPRLRPSIVQILKGPYVQAYISRLLSYTIERGQGDECPPPPWSIAFVCTTESLYVHY
jgi:hypothetical protein